MEYLSKQKALILLNAFCITGNKIPVMQKKESPVNPGLSKYFSVFYTIP